MRPQVHELIDDTHAMQAHLYALLATLDADDWDRATPSPGWSVVHQVRHLAYGEELGLLAATDPTAFAVALAEMLSDLAAVGAATTASSDESPAATAERWITTAGALLDAVAAGPADARVDWVTGPMSRASFVTARVMEAFAHGQDIAHAVGRELPSAHALPHVAHLGVATRRFAFANRGLAPPDTEVRVELAGPLGEAWSWGPDGAADRVRGTALDFCLLVTQRIHRADTDLVADGPHAEEWMGIAQCFAGPPTDGPPPTTRTR